MKRRRRTEGDQFAAFLNDFIEAIRRPFRNIAEFRDCLRGFVIFDEQNDEVMMHPRWAETPTEDYEKAVEASYAHDADPLLH